VSKHSVVFKKEEELIRGSEPIGPMFVDGVEKEWVTLKDAQALAKRLGTELEVE
jgi:hypothetical protein